MYKLFCFYLLYNQTFTIMKISSKEFLRKCYFWYNFIDAWYFTQHHFRFYSVHYLFSDKSKVHVYQTQPCFSVSHTSEIVMVTFDLYTSERFESDLRLFTFFIKACNPVQIKSFLDFVHDMNNRTLILDCFAEFCHFVQSLI